MRRGCVSVGEIQCDDCHRTIPYLEYYLAIDEEDEREGGTEKDRALRYCLDCCLKKGYARYVEERGERILTFFPERV